jgi:putative DNA primase/helicase
MTTKPWHQNSNEEMIGFVQRFLGYCLTGQVSEQVLPIFWGAGANGKSTLIETIMAMLGMDYSAKAPQNLLLTKRYSHPTELTVLQGKRFVVASETESGCRLAEAAVKEMVGGDTITARRMREDFWSFQPTHKIVVATNHKPVVRGTDHAIWRRLLLVPFLVTIPPAERDRSLPDQLKEELPGILSWCVQGCLKWQELGLEQPAAVQRATTDYRTEEDTLLGFIRECCVEAPTAQAKSSDLLARYRAWTGDSSMNEQKLGKLLSDRGFSKKKSSGIIWRIGVGIPVEPR